MTIGASVGHYTIIETLGTGGMGEVYLAQDTRLGRKVALKILPRHLASDPERRARFEHEARAIAALNHPNIVTIYSVDQDGDTYFITMEFVSGSTLSRLIPPRGLPLRQFFDFAIPLADAIGAAHLEGVTHRDLKPDNVMVTDAGRIKVLDFGLAKMRPAFLDGSAVTTAATARPRTLAGQILGTVPYLSPEQAEGKPTDHRSDVFSLGIMLHEMITGQRPFEGDSSASIVSSILRDPVPPITAINPALPSRLAAIITRCLAKDPAQRYQSAIDLRADVDGVRQDVISGIITLAVPAAPSGARRVRVFAGASLAGAVALAVLAAWYWSPRDTAMSPSSEPLPAATFEQVTHGEGQELFPTLSPDGRSVVYVSDATGNADIYAQRVGGENTINLTRDSAAVDTQPAFSPDGERIVFRSDRDGGGLFLMGATGESVRRISDFGYHPAWAPDGHQIAYVTQSVIDPSVRFTTSQLWIVHAATGAKRLVSEGDAAQPSWSPHGDRIAYWGRTAGAGSGDIWSIAVAGGEPVAVTTEPSMDWNPVWTPDGRHLYFASDRGGAMNLWRIAIDEKSGKPLGKPEAVTTGVGAAAQHIAISRDGRRLAYAARVESTNVQKISFNAVAGVTVGTPQWVTRGSRSVAQPDISPEGTQLAFNSLGKQEDLFVAHADGSSLHQVTDDGFKDRAARWSPDGRRIAFYSDRSGKYELWLVNRDGSDLRQLTHSPGAHYPVWSPDGRLMAFSTHSPNGAGIFNATTPWSAEQVRMLPAIPDATQSFEVWSWSPDGKRLAGQKHLADLSHAGIAVHEIGSNRLDWLTDFGEWPVWLRDGRRLLFSDRGTLYLLDSVTRTHRELMRLPQPSLGSVSLSLDNRNIYFTFMAAEADVWVMTMGK